MALASAQYRVELEQNPATPKLALSRNLAPIGGSDGFEPEPASCLAGHR